MPLALAVVFVPCGGKLEVLAAQVTRVGLLTRVGRQVSLQVVLLRKLLATVGALERFLSSVKLLMPETVVPERKHFAAKRALLIFWILALLSKMSSLVLVSLVTAGELLSAVSAQIRLEPDVDVGAVGFRASKGLSTHVTLVRVDTGMNCLAVDEHAAAPRKHLLTIRAGPLSQVVVSCDPDTCCV